MAYTNPSDMFSKRLFMSAIRAASRGMVVRPAAVSPNVQGMSLMELAGMSTYDKPASETIEKNAYYDKYKEKLERLKATNPESYEAAVDEVYGDKKKKKNTADTFAKESDVRGSSMMDKMKQSSAGQRSSEDKSKERPGLDSIIKMDLIQEKSPAEVTKIWQEYFSQKEGVIFATVPVDKYMRLRLKGKECPMFLYVLPRETGYEFVLGQCSGDDWYYTPLIAYQTHGEYAPYSLAIRYYTELADSKGLVLVKGEIASDEMKPELATLLTHETQLMYGSDENFKLVEKMNKTPADFKHMEVIDLCKKCGLF